MVGICTIAFSIKLISAGFGVAAATVWWQASRIKTPPEITQDQVAAVQGDVLPVLSRLMHGVASQSRLNALAAALAAIAALLQVAEVFMPTCWG
jgi:hypothetical protein